MAANFTMNLPEDVVMEIIVRLPVKSLVRFKSVCKSWSDLFKSSDFADLHLRLSQLRGDRARVLATREKTKTVQTQRRKKIKKSKTVLSFHSLDDDDDDDGFLGEISSLGGIQARDLQLLASCNGLIICNVDYNSNDIVLCNPALGESRLLPPSGPFGCPEGYHIKTEGVGFGFDPVAKDFKIVTIVSLVRKNYPAPSPRRAGIYNLNTNSWRELDVDVPRLFGYVPSPALFLNGSLYWVALANKIGVDQIILSFCTSSEEFGEIQIPSELQTMAVRVVDLDGSVGVIQESPDHFLDIWVMNDAKKSWTKQYTMGPLSRCHNLLLCWKNQILLLSESPERQLVSCAVADGRQQLKKHDVYGIPIPSHVVVYRESLISVYRSRN